MKRLLLLCALALQPLAVEAQREGAAPPPTGSISGIVVQANTKNAEPRVRVELADTVRSDAARNRITYTDDKGWFAFEQLPAGTYSLRAFAPGFLAAEFNQKKPGGPGTTIQLAAGKRFDGAALRLFRGGILAGAVHDDLGRGLPEIPVSAFNVIWWYDGQRYLKKVATTSTDDRGEFRLHSLVPGEYLVAADPPATSVASKQLVTDVQARRAYVRTFFPGSTTATAAALLPVDAGTDREALDIALAWVPLFKVSGRLTGFPGAAGGYIRSVGDLAEQVAANSYVRASPGGAFSFTSVAPRNYQLVFKTEVPNATSEETRWASATVSVAGADVTDVVMPAQTGSRIVGQVAGPANTTFSERRVPQLVPVGERWIGDGEGLTALIERDGRIIWPSIPPGRYLLSFRDQPDESYVARATLDGSDVLASGLDLRSVTTGSLAVEFRRPAASISGILIGNDGAPIASFTLIAFPVIAAERTSPSRVRTGRPDSTGAFSIKGLAPGEYYLAAVEDVADYEWTNATFLEGLIGSAMKLKLQEGQQLRQDITIK